MRLTQHFKLQEFQSKDGAEMPRNVMENIFRLSDHLQVIRNAIGNPIHINSAYRSLSHNAAIGGVKGSFHTLGMAADITSRNHTPKELYDIIEGLIESGKLSEGGLGLYKSFVHTDIRGDRARWDNS